MASDIVNSLIFNNDLENFSQLLESIKRGDPSVDYIRSMNEWDCRGQPPLHLALKLGRVPIVEQLLSLSGQYQCSVNAQNAQGWTAVDEAVCLGNRAVLERVLRRHYDEMAVELATVWRGLNADPQLREFSTAVEVKIKSPIPALARLCPKETVTVNKTASGLRVDWTIAKITGMRIKRGRMSLLLRFNPTTMSLEQAFVMSRGDKVFEELWPNLSRSVMHDLVDDLLRAGVVIDELPLAQFSLEHTTKTKKIQRRFQCKQFKLGNLGFKQSGKVPQGSALYAECTDECRSVPLKEHQGDDDGDDGDHGLVALHAISQTDLTEDFDRRLSLDDGLNIVDGEDDDDEADDEDEMDGQANADAETLRAIDSKLRDRLNTILSRQQPCDTSSSPSAGKPVNARHTHVREYSSLDAPLISSGHYFNPSIPLSRDSLGRQCSHFTRDFTKSQPMSLFMTRDLPLSLDKIMPAIEWLCGGRFVAAGVARAFVKQHSLGEHFPMRIQVPLVKMLSLKMALTHFDAKSKLRSAEMELPKDYRSAEVLPIFRP